SFLYLIRDTHSIPTDALLVTLDVRDLYTSIPHIEGIDSVRGTAMGSHAAPPYANAYMIDFEESIIYKNPLFQDNVIIWKRYIDDVFCIWRGSTETLHAFFEVLNTSWPGIGFTINYDLVRMNFLDTLVIKNPEGVLSTDLYSKSTDRNSLLHFGSLHPPSTKKSIPRAQFHRVQ
ncbi:unnamed protein product, partial [Ranitomeya imitator]